LHTEVDQSVVEVFSAQVGVSCRSLDLEDAVFDSQQSYVEGASTKVLDEHIFLSLGLLVQSIRDRSGGGLVDDAQALQTSDLRGVFGGLPLRVVEVGRHSDHGLLARLS